MVIRISVFLLMLFSVFIQNSFAQTGTHSCNPYSRILEYIDQEGRVRPVENLCEWYIKRGQILDSLEAFTGPLPEISTLPPFNPDLPDFPPFNTQIFDSLKTESYTRYNIKFTVAENEDVTAYLYVPSEKGYNGKFPAMLALQPTGMQGKMIVDGQGKPNRGYAKELAERGYVVIAPDYPGYGDQSGYDFKSDRYESGIMKAVFNHIRCVDFLQARKDVNPERIGVIGHSLGGHSAIFVAVFDTRIKVIVSSCGWTLFRYYNNYNEKLRIESGSRLTGWAQERYSPLALTKYKLELNRMPFDFDELIAALSPRPFFSNSPVHDANFNVEGVRIGIANAMEVYRLFDAEENLQVRYPYADHDFPPEVRFESYDFIDKILKSDH